MAIKQTQQGFALIVAVIFMSVMLSFGLALGSLGYKQQVLSSGAIESQYAFYAADSALECALYADQQQNTFNYSSHSSDTHPALITCDTHPAVELGYSYGTTLLVVSERISLDEGKHCADVTVYKYSAPDTNNRTTYIYSQGYSVSCGTIASPDGARFSSRGVSTRY